jgi:hypothetical protein
MTTCPDCPGAGDLRCCMAEVFALRRNLLTFAKSAAVGPTEQLLAELGRIIAIDVSSEPVLVIEPVEEAAAYGTRSARRRERILQARRARRLVSRP